MKSFMAQRIISIYVNLRYLRLKLLNIKKIMRKCVILLIITVKIYLYIIMS